MNCYSFIDVEELGTDDAALKLSALSNAARTSIYNLDSSTKKESCTISTNCEVEHKDQHEPSNEPKRNNALINYDTFDNFGLKKVAEKQRRDCVKKEVETMQRVFSFQNDKEKEFHTQSCLLAKKKMLVRKCEEELLILKEAEQIGSKLTREHKSRFIFQKDELQKRLEKLKEEQILRQKKSLCEEIYKFQMKFAEGYERITIQFHQIDKTIYTNVQQEINNNLKHFIEMFDGLIYKVKVNEIEPNDLKIAESLCKGIEKLQKQIDGIINAVNKESKAEEQKIKETVTDTTKVEVQEKLKDVQEENTNKKTDNNNLLTHFVTKENFALYNDIMEFYTSKVESVKPLQADENMKKYRSNCQKSINIPVNAISAVNSQHLQDKYEKLYSLVSGSPIKIADGFISAADHPLGRDFCLLLLAKKFVSQGDSTVSSNSQAAFPIAAIIVSIWQKIPDFGKLFLAYAYKECPYLVPYFIPQFNNQTTEDYYKLLGYRLTDGVLEKQDMYLKRQTGIIKLYAAILVTKVRPVDGKNHPHGIENGWRWLNSLLNLDPLPDICATLILGFLQVAGFEMWKVYRKQFTKVLQLIQQQYFPKLSKVDEGGPKSRLEVFLMEVMKNEKIEEPLGLLPANFW